MTERVEVPANDGVTDPTTTETTVAPTHAAVADEARVAEAIAALLDTAGVDWQRKLVTRIIESGIDLGLDGTTRLDLKISAAALEEMRSAFRLFEPFAGIPKASIFGSARTQPHDPLSVQAEGVSRRLAELGWMVVTGAGPGIMEASAVGAGPEHSLGVSIRLPFEELPQHYIAYNDRLVSMKYFFTRKLMLVKESLGFICLPGGFGTMDETFELLTLQQTGKAIPVPIVLLDRPGGTFWRGFEDFVVDHLEGTGMITAGDLDRVLVTDSVDEAVAEVTGFWRNYESLRWIPQQQLGTNPLGAATADAGSSQPNGDLLVLRLRAEPTDRDIDELNQRFGHLVQSGRIERVDPLPPERSGNDRLELPRIALHPHRRAVGELHRLIRAINELPSAPSATPAPPTPEAE